MNRAACLALAFACSAGCSDSDSKPARSDGGPGGAPSSDSGPLPSLTTEERAALSKLALDAVPPPPPDVSNAFADDADAALLGRRLFFDSGFSGRLLDGDNDGSEFALGNEGDTGKVACAGCHVPDGQFSDTRSLGGSISLGAGWGLRRAPSLLDVSRSKVIMWDGRRDALYNQVFGPIENPVEMNSSRLYAAQQIFARHADEYQAIFGALPPLGDAGRFPPLSAEETGCLRLNSNHRCDTAQRGSPGDGAEFDGLSGADQDAVTRVVVNAGKAIGAYERLLECGTSRFDAFMAGDESALDAAELRGAKLFVGKADCVKCHEGPFLSDEKFHNVGLKPEVVAAVFIDANDSGAKGGIEKLIDDPLNVRGEYSDGDDDRTPTEVTAGDEGAFRTPRLRCVSKRPTFMHTGHVVSLADVVLFFDGGGNAVGYPGKNELTPLGLTPDERADVVAFLRALDGPGADPALHTPP